MADAPVYHVRRTASPIVIDGRLDEFDWMAAERILFRKFRHEPEDEQPLRESTQVAALWDAENLYLGFIVEDSEIWTTIEQHDARLFPEECVEFFIDPGGDGRRYIEAQINSRGAVRDLLVDAAIAEPTCAQYDEMARWDFETLEMAIGIHRDRHNHDVGWTLEIAIPWSEFRFSQRRWPPRPNDELRVNLYRYERPRTGSLPLELSGWSPVRHSFHEPSRFGRFVFAQERTPPANPAGLHPCPEG